MPERRARRFHAFCVGLPKTGTTSIWTMFEDYRSAKSDGSHLEMLGCDLRDGKRTEEEVGAFLVARDAEAWLEMDASSANWMMRGVLRDRFPDARFILTIRDCYSWCDSMLNVLIRHKIGEAFLKSPVLFEKVLRCELAWFRDVDAVVEHGEVILRRLVDLWCEQEKTALACPPSRTLVVRTNDISPSLPAIARFVGVPPETLLVERAHSRKTDERLGVLASLDRRIVEAAFARCAASDLMKEHFPRSTLDGFLRRAARMSPRAEQAQAPPRRDEVPEDLVPVGGWLRRAHDAAASGDVPGAKRALATATKQMLEPDEIKRISAVQALMEAAAVVKPPETSGDDDPEAVRTHPALALALGVIRAEAANGLPQRFGHRLQHAALQLRGSSCYALLGFVSARGPFVLELVARRPGEGYWLASERFAVSYRRDTPATIQADLQMATALLDAVERELPSR